MKTAILNLNKWVAKTAEAVRRVCQGVQAPCVGFALLFLEINDKGQKEWRFKIEMAGDPNEGWDNPDRERLEKALEYIMAGVQKIYDGADEEMDQFVARADWH